MSEYLTKTYPLTSSSRKMLTKDKKPEVKEGEKESAQVIPIRPETPKLYKAALVVTEVAGMKGGTFAKLKGQKGSDTAREVNPNSTVDP